MDQFLFQFLKRISNVRHVDDAICSRSRFAFINVSTLEILTINVTCARNVL